MLLVINSRSKQQHVFPLEICMRIRVINLLSSHAETATKTHATKDSCKNAAVADSRHSYIPKSWYVTLTPNTLEQITRSWPTKQGPEQEIALNGETVRSYAHGKFSCSFCNISCVM